MASGLRSRPASLPLQTWPELVAGMMHDSVPGNCAVWFPPDLFLQYRGQLAILCRIGSVNRPGNKVRNLHPDGMAGILKEQAFDEAAVAGNRAAAMIDQGIMMRPKQPVVVPASVIRNHDAQTVALLQKILKAFRQRLVGEMVKLLLVLHGCIVEGRANVRYACNNRERAGRDDLCETQAQRLSLFGALTQHGVLG